MKVKLKNVLGLAALGVSLLVNTVPTWAGSVATPEVSIKRITTTYTTASGSMVGARYSADNKQYIGCTISTYPLVVCSAQDSTNNYASCISYDARHIDAVQRMTDSSVLVFEFNPKGSACGTIRIYNNSRYLK